MVVVYHVVVAAGAAALVAQRAATAVQQRIVDFHIQEQAPTLVAVQPSLTEARQAYVTMVA